MIEKITDHITFILYALAMISGGMSGCAAASHSILSGKRQQRLSFFFAYGIIGMVFGLLVAASGFFNSSVEQMIIASVMAGFSGSMALAGANLSARLMLKKLGIEVEVTVRKSGQ